MGFRSLWLSTLDLIFPRSCHHCDCALQGESNPCFCRNCWSSIAFLEDPRCPSCGKPFVSKAALLYSPEHRCGDCRDRPPRFDRSVAVGSYEGVLAKAIQLFKYQGKTNLADPLGTLLISGLEKLSRADCLIPVPLHPKRLREREYNQALLLCDSIGDRTGLEVIPDALERVLETPPQTGLPLKDRRRNVRGAFVVKRAQSVNDRLVLLIDDVLTTGATVNECARTLKRAGAKAVYVLTLARVAPS
jgi:ComF family protein